MKLSRKTLSRRYSLPIGPEGSLASSEHVVFIVDAEVFTVSTAVLKKTLELWKRWAANKKYSGDAYANWKTYWAMLNDEQFTAYTGQIADFLLALRGEEPSCQLSDRKCLDLLDQWWKQMCDPNRDYIKSDRLFVTFGDIRNTRRRPIANLMLA